MAKDTTEVKDKIIQTMVTEETLTELQQEASKLGLTMSAYVRTLILSRNDNPIHRAIIGARSDSGVK